MELLKSNRKSNVLMKLKPIIKKKKGFQDYSGLFFALAVIFAAAIFFIILSFAFGQAQPKLGAALGNATEGSETTFNTTAMLEKTDSAIIGFNTLFPFLLIGVFGFVLVVALMGTSHPVFLFIGLIVLGVVLILAAVYSNVYTQITDDDNFAGTDADFNIMGFMLDNLPVIMIILFVAIAIILYSRIGQQGISGGTM